MTNNPFMPPVFKDTVPKGGWNTYTGPQEDGPGFYSNPANSTTPARYNGQDQVARINSANPVSITTPPSKCTLPGAASGMSKLP